jgi:hypothetical protein
MLLLEIGLYEIFYKLVYRKFISVQWYSRDNILTSQEICILQALFKRQFGIINKWKVDASRAGNYS